LGGIYALERIDKESTGRAYHSTVMEVLMAYVRENSHWEHEKPYTSTTTSNEVVEQDKGVAQEAQSTLQGLPTDIRAILDVLKRREEENVSKEHRVLSLDLREANLYGVNLRGVNLSGADLQDVNLSGANLLGANFQEANLQDVNLSGANFSGARGLKQRQIEQAIGSNVTQLPKGLTRPDLWSERIEEQQEILPKRLFSPR